LAHILIGEPVSTSPEYALDTSTTIAGAAASLGNKRPRSATQDNTAADGAATVRTAR
jgi:hypothetical protein